ncbi:MAG TPA: hypothetical protein VIY48_08110 [Candidatus Paceibacterota bacterium]
MNALEIATQVAAHPAMIRLRTQMEALRRQMIRDYGDDFMLLKVDMPELILPNGRKSPRYAGVHFWTPQQRIEWFTLERRMRNARTALKSVYSAT